MTTARLQFQHHLCQTFVRYFVLDLFFVSLRNLIVLAIDAAQIAIAEKNIARAARAGERRLFAEVRRVRRNDWQPPRIAGGDFVFQTIVQTVARTNRAAFQQGLQRLDATIQLAGLQEAEI